MRPRASRVLHKFFTLSDGKKRSMAAKGYGGGASMDTNLKTTNGNVVTTGHPMWIAGTTA